MASLKPAAEPIRGRKKVCQVQVEGSCCLSGTNPGEPVADGILAAVKRLDVDILVMGISGYS